VSWTSRLDELVRYARERFTARVGVLVLLLAGASLAGRPCAGAFDGAARLLLAALLVAGFRLWDDLSDRELDRARHPGRVLVRATALGHYHVLLALTLLLNLAVVGLRGPAEAVAVLLGLHAVLLGWYRGLRGRVPGALPNTLVVLLKYPVFVYLLAGRPGVPAGTALAAPALLYAGLCAYEIVPDRRPRPPRPRSAFMNRPAAAPDPSLFEAVACYLCGGTVCTPLVTAQDDYTGKPGRFRFVRCSGCGLAYQTPRLRLENVKAYYDDEYIAHRKKTDWGLLTPLYRRAMERHDRDKERLVARYVPLGPGLRLLDAGCGAGTFLARLRRRHRCEVAGVDFKDLSHLPGLRDVDFRLGLFYEQEFPADHFDLITMWHFLEHDYDPLRTLRAARRLLRPEGRLVVEVPRLDSATFRLYRERWPGLQAPQHTVLCTRATLLRCLRQCGWEVVAYLPYGAFPAYFYLFAGAAFKVLRGRGINLGAAIYP
jgi:SAM-dependent methyltransferase